MGGRGRGREREREAQRDREREAETERERWCEREREGQREGRGVDGTTRGFFWGGGGMIDGNGLTRTWVDVDGKEGGGCMIA